jgi:hypothetical protein
MTWQPWFSPNVDGHFLPAHAARIYEKASSTATTRARYELLDAIAVQLRAR